tara:strand:+ start:5898 stop:7346 length:1449 start_codon:yes stop_codon:yes gene_type:complete
MSDTHLADWLEQELVDAEENCKTKTSRDPESSAVLEFTMRSEESQRIGKRSSDIAFRLDGEIARSKKAARKLAAAWDRQQQTGRDSNEDASSTAPAAPAPTPAPAAATAPEVISLDSDDEGPAAAAVEQAAAVEPVGQAGRAHAASSSAASCSDDWEDESETGDGGDAQQEEPDDETQRCYICFETAGVSLHTLSCGHVLCIDCMTTGLKLTADSACGVCRRAYDVQLELRRAGAPPMATHLVEQAHRTRQRRAESLSERERFLACRANGMLLDQLDRRRGPRGPRRQRAGDPAVAEPEAPAEAEAPAKADEPAQAAEEPEERPTLVDAVQRAHGLLTGGLGRELAMARAARAQQQPMQEQPMEVDPAVDVAQGDGFDALFSVDKQMCAPQPRLLPLGYANAEEKEAWDAAVEAGQVAPCEVHNLRDMLHDLDRSLQGVHHQAAVVGPLTAIVLRDLASARGVAADEHAVVQLAVQERLMQE